MWAYRFKRERKDESVEQCREWAHGEFPKHLLGVYVGKKVVNALVKAEIDAETAALLAKHHCLVPGSAILVWYEPLMEADLRRQVQDHDEPLHTPEQLLEMLRSPLDFPGNGR